jgi:phage baseplate assembly protein W
MKKTLKITDLDFSFRAHPLSGNLVLKNGEEAIKQSVKNLVLLNMFEKPFSRLGGNITNRLFEDFSFSLISSIKDDLVSLLSFYEPRIEVLPDEIFIDKDKIDENMLNITINYTIIGEDVPKQEINLEVSRSR